MFDVEDEMLVPLAGNCVRCVKRTANAPGVRRPHVYDSEEPAQQGNIFMKGTADACTDPDCFDEKKKAHLKREAAKLEAGGATVVVQGNAAKRGASAPTGEMRKAASCRSTK